MRIPIGIPRALAAAVCAATMQAVSYDARGLTFDELLARSRQAAGAKQGSIGDPAVLAYVLRDEVRRGRVEYHSTSRRYVLNGGLPEDVKQALRKL